jgi:hypothetical protein
MDIKIISVKGGFHAKGPGFGREIVGFGRTREEAQRAFVVGRDRSLRLDQEAQRVATGAGSMGNA